MRTEELIEKAIKSGKFEVLPREECAEWHLGYSEAPYALCHENDAVWGLDREMSLEEALRDFENLDWFCSECFKSLDECIPEDESRLCRACEADEAENEMIDDQKKEWEKYE